MKKKWLVIALFLCTLIGVMPSALAATTSDAGADANLDAAAVVAPETDAAPIVGAVPVSDVAPTAEADMERLKIQFENGIHYIEDPDYPGKKITLFCMNNLSHWPHHTQDIGDLQVPDYVEGYLTPKHFKSVEDYNECMLVSPSCSMRAIRTTARICIRLLPTQVNTLPLRKNSTRCSSAPPSCRQHIRI